MAIYNCPKCRRFGMAWDGRAKILMCYYKNCSHGIRIENQREVPSIEVIRAAIDADKSGKSVGKSVRSVMKSDKQWDDPECDSTDWAHPAWWRGSLHGLHGAIRLVENIVTGKETGVGAMYEDADKLRQMVLGLKRKANSLVDERDGLVRERDGLVRERNELGRNHVQQTASIRDERDNLKRGRDELEWKYAAMCDARVDWIKRSKTLQDERDNLKRSLERSSTERDGLVRERDSLRCAVERQRELNETRWSSD